MCLRARAGVRRARRLMAPKHDATATAIPLNLFGDGGLLTESFANFSRRVCASAGKELREVSMRAVDWRWVGGVGEAPGMGEWAR